MKLMIVRNKFKNVRFNDPEDHDDDDGGVYSTDETTSVIIDD